LKKFGGTLIPSIFLKTLENNLIVTQLLSSFPKIIVNVMTNKLAAKRLRNTALEGHIQMFLLVPTFQVKYVTFPRIRDLEFSGKDVPNEITIKIKE